MSDAAGLPGTLELLLGEWFGAGANGNWAELVLPPEPRLGLLPDQDVDDFAALDQTGGTADVTLDSQRSRGDASPVATAALSTCAPAPNNTTSTGGDESIEKSERQQSAGRSARKTPRQLARRTQVRDQTKAELQYLRQHAQELELLLESLKGSAVRETWCHLTRPSESDNEWLKAMLAESLALVRGMEQFLCKRPRPEHLLLGDTDENKLRRRKKQHAFGIDVDDVALLSRFLSEVDDSFQLVDSVLGDSSDRIGEAASPIATTKTTSNGRQALCLEFRDATVIPFPSARIVAAAWASAKRRYERDEHVLYAVDDRPDDTITVHFPAISRGRKGLCDNIVAICRYVSNDRMVWVWRALLECTDEFKHVVNDETGWCVYQAMPTPDGTPCTATSVQSCVHVVSLQRGSREPVDLSAQQRSGLSKLLTDAYVNDGEALNAMMENLLLDDPLGF